MENVFPSIIQGGMGVGISSWSLAKVVSQAGHLGVVSGVGIDTLLLRLLQLGDPGGHIARAAAKFPLKDASRFIFDKYFKPGGIDPKIPFRIPRAPVLVPSLEDVHLRMFAAYTEVFLAKENHQGVVGINLLEKLQLTTLAAIYGAMLAGVNYIIVGAGIPAQYPEIIENLSQGREAEMKIDVEGTPLAGPVVQKLSPKDVFGLQDVPTVTKPKFLAIVSSVTLANFLEKRTQGKVDGYIIEGHTAGGHNAPPRDHSAPVVDGDLQYGPKDEVNLESFRKIGKPFWLAGSKCSHEGLVHAQKEGAKGIQVGSAFALADESGLTRHYKDEIITTWKNSNGAFPVVKTSALASPTGFPFKVATLPHTLTDMKIYAERPRICDMGNLRKPYAQADGSIGYRCPAEPVADYVKKGGDAKDCENRACLCNALFANLGLPQRRKNGGEEDSLVTLGSNLSFLKYLVPGDKKSYSALDVINYLLNPLPA